MAHAVAILGNPTDAEDALQEAFLDAYRALDRFDEGRSFYSWFYTILRNRCWKLLGSHNRPDRAAEDVEILPQAAAISTRHWLSGRRSQDFR